MSLKAAILFFCRSIAAVTNKKKYARINEKQAIR